MLKNPYKNAILAAGYIALIVLSINLFARSGPDDNIFAPMVMLSLLVLSVAVMAVLFFYEPARLFLEGSREEALKFFTKTILTFACFAALFILLLFLF